MKRKLRKINKRSDDLPYCECGCGERVAKKGNKYIRGHNTRSQNLSESNNIGFKRGNQYGKGRPAGSRNKVSIAAENIFEDESGTIARKAVDMALKGNPAMIKLIMKRVVPVKRSTVIKIPGMPKINGVADADKLTGFLLTAVSDGTISPLDCEIVSRVADKHLRALQVNDLEQRLYELEQLLEEQGKV